MCDIGRNDDGTLHFAPKRHIETMVHCYFKIFGTKPKLSLSSPLEKSDHPELDTSECLDSDGVQQCQSMIGAIQWDEYLGRLDVNARVINL